MHLKREEPFIECDEGIRYEMIGKDTIIFKDGEHEAGNHPEGPPLPHFR